jgi:hypothetical protein
MVIDGNHKMPINEPKIFSCICGNTYKYRPGLARHKRTCVAINTQADAPTDTPIFMEITEQPQAEDFICSDDKITITKEMFMTLVKNSEEIMKLIKEQHLMVPNQVINNTNNNNCNNNNYNKPDNNNNNFQNSNVRSNNNNNTFRAGSSSMDFPNKN